jgi:hypothetical protein
VLKPTINTANKIKTKIIIKRKQKKNKLKAPKREKAKESIGRINI